jgi:hypothetical protein
MYFVPGEVITTTWSCLPIDNDIIIIHFLIILKFLAAAAASR